LSGATAVSCLISGTVLRKRSQQLKYEFLYQLTTVTAAIEATVTQRHLQFFVGNYTFCCLFNSNIKCLIFPVSGRRSTHRIRRSEINFAEEILILILMRNFTEMYAVGLGLRYTDRRTDFISKTTVRRWQQSNCIVQGSCKITSAKFILKWCKKELPLLRD
jgi:hypothetical protein